MDRFDYIHSEMIQSNNAMDHRIICVCRIKKIAYMYKDSSRFGIFGD